MKILVDQEELNRAFDIVSDVKNAIESLADGDMISTEEYGGLLQKACNILGPMWADGTDARKVLVERELIMKGAELLWTGKPRDAERARRILLDILESSPDFSLDEDSINQQISDSAWNFVQGNTPHDITADDRRWADEAIEKHLKEQEEIITIKRDKLTEIFNIINHVKDGLDGSDKEALQIVCNMLKELILCKNKKNKDGHFYADKGAEKPLEKHDDSQIPVRSKEQNIQAIKDALAKDPGKISISPLPKGPPDPRCDGCEYQHPYAENLSYDVIAGKVYCNRGTRPTYYKEGRTIQYPPNLMICGVYYLENGTIMKSEPRENITYDFLEKPDPRCNGCEFQHPFAELLSYDTTNQLVYCGRDTNPSYHSEGRRVRYPHGTEKPQGIKMCHMYYLNNGELAKFGTEWNPPCAQYCIPEIEKIMEREVNNHLAIIEILNILDSSSCSRGWDRTTELRNKVKALKAKIIKGEEII